MHAWHISCSSPTPSSLAQLQLAAMQLIPSHFEIEIGATNFLYSRMSSTPEQPEQQDIDKWMGSEDGLTASRRDVMGY